MQRQGRKVDFTGQDIYGGIDVHKDDCVLVQRELDKRALWNKQCFCCLLPCLERPCSALSSFSFGD